MNIPSDLIQNAVNEFTKLPGIGKKTALRLVLHLLNQEEEDVEQFGNTIVKMRKELKYCNSCHNISDDLQCSICSSTSRDRSVICVVENIRDILAIENTNQFSGLFHVLGGVISPLDGIGPDQLNIASLLLRATQEEVKEVIMGLSPTMEGDTTIFYLSKKLVPHNIRVTTIARGVAFGGELEYTDELTLARSIATRLPYENYLSKNKKQQ